MPCPVPQTHITLERPNLLPGSHCGLSCAGSAEGPLYLQGVGSACRKPPKFSWEAHIAQLSDAEFKQRYRLAPQSFDKLLSILEPDLS